MLKCKTSIMKRLFLLFLIICSASFNSCIKNGEDEFSQKQCVLKLAETHPENFPTTSAANYFARLVNERSHGRITVKVYTNGSLGDELSVVEQVQYGGIDFARVSMSVITNFYPEMDVLTLPFIYKNKVHQWEVLNGQIGHSFLSNLKNVGLTGLCYYDSGARSFYITKDVSSIDELKNKKIRIQESDVMEAFISRFGATPVKLPFTEVASALRDGIVDGAENNWSSFMSSGCYKYAPYFIQDEHARIPEVLIASSLALQKLPLEDRILIKQCAQDSVMYQMELWQEYEENAKSTMLQSGVKLIELPSDQITELKKAAIRSYRELPTSQLKVLEEIFTLGKKYQ